MTAGTPATRVLKQATSTISIVIAGVGDAVGAGLVAALARPGGNVTGLSVLGPESTAKRLELLRELVPGLSQVAVLSNPGNPHSALEFAWARGAAQALRLRVHLVAAGKPEELEGVFSTLITERVGALVVLGGRRLFRHRSQIAALATKGGLPLASDRREYTAAGGLLAYGPSFQDSSRRAAAYVDKILKGAEPADPPVEQPTSFELLISLPAAQALGLTIPRSILIRADEAIE